MLLDIDEAALMYKAKKTDTRSAVFIRYNSELAMSVSEPLEIFEDETLPQIETTMLTGCIVVYIVVEPSRDKIFALHVTPNQARGIGSLIPYSQIKPYLPYGTKISVLVGGHTQNFNEIIFREKMQEMGLGIIQLTIGKICTGRRRAVVAELYIGNDTMLIADISLRDGNPNKYETISFSASSTAVISGRETVTSFPDSDDLVNPTLHSLEQVSQNISFLSAAKARLFKPAESDPEASLISDKLSQLGNN